MGKLENKVELFLDDEIVKYGGRTYKFVSPGRKNVPDRIVMLYGQIWFIEVKALGQKLRPGQEREINNLKELGMKAGWVSGIAGVKEFLTEEFGFKYK